MVEWHHQLNGHKFESSLGVGDGQGSLADCSPWGLKESDNNQFERGRNIVNIYSSQPLVVLYFVFISIAEVYYYQKLTFG